MTSNQKSVPQALNFLKRFIRSPRSIGSVAPSSPALVAAMLDDVDWAKIATVAELGAGTGVITSWIDRLRPSESKFMCFEKHPKMHRTLCDRFPDVIMQQDAFQLKRLLQTKHLSGLDCVVCGLPLVNFPRGQRESLLSDIHASLNPGGFFIAFQYTRRLRPVLLATYEQIECRFVWANLPPAYVFVCRK